MRKENLANAELQGAEESSNAAVVYDRVAKAWQLLMGKDLHFGYFENAEVSLEEATVRLTRKMGEWAQLRPETRVLDVGCGIGGPALLLAENLGCHVTGISTSGVGVQLAMSRAEAQGLSSRVEFLERDGMANGFADESFDCVWIMESSHLMERKDRLMAECSRVLRPDGVVVLCDIVLRETIPFQYLVRNLAEFENLNAVFGKQNVELLSAYRELAEKSGLTVLRTEDISEAVFPTMEQWRRNAETHQGEVRELVGEEYLERFVRACGFLERLWKEEKLGYGMMLAGKDSGPPRRAGELEAFPKWEEYPHTPAVFVRVANKGVTWGQHTSLEV